jgi:hypothetical protein
LIVATTTAARGGVSCSERCLAEGWGMEALAGKPTTVQTAYHRSNSPPPFALSLSKCRLGTSVSVSEKTRLMCAAQPAPRLHPSRHRHSLRPAQPRETAHWPRRPSLRPCSAGCKRGARRFQVQTAQGVCRWGKLPRGRLWGLPWSQSACSCTQRQLKRRVSAGVAQLAFSVGPHKAHSY